jgi:hypothetical protein
MCIRKSKENEEPNMTPWMRAVVASAIFWSSAGGWLTAPVAGDDTLPETTKVDDLSRLPANT